MATKLERDACEYAAEQIKSCGVSREHVKMLDSAEFKLGWKLCAEKAAELFLFIGDRAKSKRDPKDLKLYARQLKPRK